MKSIANIYCIRKLFVRILVANRLLCSPTDSIEGSDFKLSATLSLKANGLHFQFCHTSQFHYHLASSWKMIAGKLASSMLTTSKCSDLLVMNAIARRFLVQHCIPLCDQFHARSCQQPPTITCQLVTEYPLSQC